MATEEERRRAFLAQMLPDALRWEKESGIPAALLLAILGNESNFGAAPSLFGIKGSGSGGTANLATHEVVNGQRVNINDAFAVNKTPDDAFRQFITLISGQASEDAARRYGPAWQRYQRDGDAVGLLAGINAAGYATDPNWWKSIVNLSASLPVVTPAPRESAAPQRNQPMPAPPPTQQSDRDLWIASGYPIYVDKRGIESAYITNADGSETHIFFYPDGRHEVAEVFGTAAGTQQYQAIEAAYRAAGYTGSEVNRSVGTTGTLNAPSLSPTAPNSSVQSASNPVARAAAAGLPAPAIAATGTPLGTPNDYNARVLRNEVAGPPNPRTTAGREALGNVETALGYTGGQRPAPVGYVPGKVIPPGFTGDYLRTLATDKGVPLYTGTNARLAGLPTVAASSPGSVSVVSQAGGLGFNPLAIQASERGLGSFNIPFGAVNETTVGQMQTNPYSASNPIEAARLSGALVKEPMYVTNGLGQTTVVNPQQVSGPGANDYNQPAAHLAGGSHGLVLRGPATVIDNATGSIVATLAEVRPEELIQHPGRIAVDNAVPGTSRYGFTRMAEGGDFTNADATFPASTSAEGASPTDTSGDPAGTPAPAPAVAGAPPPSTPVTAASYNTGFSIPALPSLPNPSVNPPARGNYSDAEAYAIAVKQYENQYGVGGPVGALNEAALNAQAQNANARYNALTQMVNNQGLNAEIGRMRREQQSGDYKYGLAGLERPTEVAPPLGRLTGEGLPPLGPGYRYGILTPEEALAREYPHLTAAGATIRDIIDAAKARAEADLAKAKGGGAPAPHGLGSTFHTAPPTGLGAELAAGLAASGFGGGFLSNLFAGLSPGHR